MATKARAREAGERLLGAFLRAGAVEVTPDLQLVLQDAVRHDGDADVSSRKPLAAYGSAEGSGWFERMAGEDFPEFATTTQ